MAQMWPWIKVRSASAYCRNSKNVHTARPLGARFLVPEKTVQLKNTLCEVYTYVLKEIFFKETCNTRILNKSLEVTSVFGTNCTYYVHTYCKKGRTSNLLSFLMHNSSMGGLELQIVFELSIGSMKKLSNTNCSWNFCSEKGDGVIACC